MCALPCPKRKVDFRFVCVDFIVLRLAYDSILLEFWFDYSGTWMFSFGDFAIMHPVPQNAQSLAGLPVCCKNQRGPPISLLCFCFEKQSLLHPWHGTLPSGFFKLNFNLITLQTSVSCCCNRMPEARHFETKDVLLWRLPIPMAWLWLGWWALDCVTWWMTSSWWLHLCEGAITRGRKQVRDGRGQICSFLITLI